MSAPIRGSEGIRGFYDDPEVVENYVARRTSQPLNSVLHERQVAFLSQVIADVSPRRVLEVAPGPGRLTAEVARVPFGVGMDFSPRMLGEARKATRTAGRDEWCFIRGDGFRLPFASRTFDLAFSVRFVRRFEPASRTQLYAEIRRVLRPGGHLVLDAQNRLVAGPHRVGREYPVYDELWRREELVAELERAGFLVRRLEGIMRRFGLQWRLNRLRRLGLAGPARMLIRALEHGSDENPSTWMVLCQVRPGRDA